MFLLSVTLIKAIRKGSRWWSTGSDEDFIYFSWSFLSNHDSLQDPLSWDSIYSTVFQIHRIEQAGNMCRTCICTVLEIVLILHRCCVGRWKPKGDKEVVLIKRKKQQGDLITKQSCSMEWDGGSIWNQKRFRVFAARVTCAWGM